MRRARLRRADSGAVHPTEVLVPLGLGERTSDDRAGPRRQRGVRDEEPAHDTVGLQGDQCAVALPAASDGSA